MSALTAQSNVYDDYNIGCQEIYNFPDSRYYIIVLAKYLGMATMGVQFQVHPDNFNFVVHNLDYFWKIIPHKSSTSKFFPHSLTLLRSALQSKLVLRWT